MCAASLSIKSLQIGLLSMPTTTCEACLLPQSKITSSTYAYGLPELTYVRCLQVALFVLQVQMQTWHVLLIGLILGVLLTHLCKQAGFPFSRSPEILSFWPYC